MFVDVAENRRDEIGKPDTASLEGWARACDDQVDRAGSGATRVHPGPRLAGTKLCLEDGKLGG